MRVALVLLSLCVFVSPYVSDGRSPEPVLVVSATAPVYPAIAYAAHQSGDVTVVTEINKSGDVTSARVESGPNLLRGVSVEAARRWKFSSGSEEHRQATLTFTFRFV